MYTEWSKWFCYKFLRLLNQVTISDKSEMLYYCFILLYFRLAFVMFFQTQTFLAEIIVK